MSVVVVAEISALLLLVGRHIGMIFTPPAPSGVQVKHAVGRTQSVPMRTHLFAECALYRYFSYNEPKTFN